MKNLLFAALAAAIAFGASAAGDLDLNGEWELKAFSQPDKGAVRSLPLPARLETKTYRATVPGCCEIIHLRSFFSAPPREEDASGLAAYREIDARVAAAVPYVLLWQTDSTRILYWNKFGTPRTVLSRLGRENAVLSYWWYDSDRVEELERAVRGGTCLPAVPELVDYDEETGGDGR